MKNCNCGKNILKNRHKLSKICSGIGKSFKAIDDFYKHDNYRDYHFILPKMFPGLKTVLGADQCLFKIPNKKAKCTHYVHNAGSGHLSSLLAPGSLDRQ